MNILNTTNLQELRKQIQKLKKENPEEKIAVVSQDDEFNRKALEIKGISIFIINEELNKKDYIKQRDSSLNEVLTEIAAKSNIKIGIDINQIITKSNEEKAKSLSRLMQNISLCKKSGAKLLFILKKKQIDKRSLQSILISLGATTKQAQEAIKEGF